MMDVLRRHPRLSAFTAYSALAVVATWPLLARFGTAVAGGGPGAWRTVWAFWWWGESLGRHASPFFSDALRWPTGAPLPLEVVQLPSAVATLPLWPLTPAIPEVSLYNAVVLVSYPLAGLATYLLGRETWGGELGPFLAGAIYTVGALHLGATGHADAVSAWPPVYFLGLARTVRRHGAGGPLLAGAALALAALTAPAHLAVCVVGTVVLLVAWWRSDGAALTSASFAHRLALLLVTSSVLGGWAYLGALRVAAGAASTAAPGVDLVSFLAPGAGSAWAVHPAPDGAGGPAAHAGYVVLALAAVAAVRARASRPWIAVAVAGLVLALGSHLRVAGAELPWPSLPLRWVSAAFPGASAAIPPGPFAWLVTFGLAVAAGAALAEIVRARRRGALVAVAVTLLAVVEAWPASLPTSSWPSPRFLRDLARDAERWTVLDATRPERQLWNQVLHRHPQLGGAIDDRGEDRSGGGTGSAFVDALVERAPPARGAVGSAPAQRQDAVRALQRRNVRFVIVDDETLSAGRALRLPRAWSGDGLVVFEVPPGAG